MSFYKRSGAVKALLAVVSMLVLMACGGENDVSPPPAPTAAPKVIEATATPVAPMATVVIPTASPTAVPTATPEPPQELNEFGFVMTLDRGAYINSLPTNTDSQGIVQLGLHHQLNLLFLKGLFSPVVQAVLCRLKLQQSLVNISSLDEWS